MTHDHPDPDALSSAWALAHLARRLHGIRARIAYGGFIGRMENRMMVRLLRIPARPLRPRDLRRCRATAIVDSQPVFQNNPFPPGRRADLVIDHHPRHPGTRARLALIDETLGASATLLSEALLASGSGVPTRLATALAYGIESETQGLGRDAGPRDIAVYKAMFFQSSAACLFRIRNPPRPDSFFRTLERALQRAFISGRNIGVHLGPVPSQDIVSHMADLLLSHERMRWSIVTGRYEGRLYISLRSKDVRARAGELLRRLMGETTAAGGHGMAAGGAVRVGRSAPAARWEEAESRLTAAFLGSQGSEGGLGLRRPYARGEEVLRPARRPVMSRSED